MTAMTPINNGFKIASLNFFFNISPSSYPSKLIIAPKNKEFSKKVFIMDYFFFPFCIICCVTCPVTPITMMVVSNVIKITGIQIGCNTFHEFNSPTPAGINITGIISMKKRAVSCTCSN